MKYRDGGDNATIEERRSKKKMEQEGKKSLSKEDRGREEETIA